MIYDGDDLFVSIPQFTINFPSCIKQLGGSSEALDKLFSFAYYVEETAHAMKCSLIKNKRMLNTISHIFNNDDFSSTISTLFPHKATSRLMN
ncbi:uncharacterized protein BX663DRAFT_527284 [Cokeromyces recurvatus]|uniref:uncharacterized protein n=1 Tax=Cokeromyces recurvatus TaxID=90255 RepID=UPI00221F5D5B|nr:uncharacterized protein BX663DRAFT_527284 [Cokeromyces recurvatus]KAI7897708.1 hypothetical protein BX663DRAFT_527284 [Cokeromyces recurvatus]